MIKISIITVNKNNLAGLKKTFNSVIAQSFSDKEWIIIDGASEDGSKEFLDENASQISYWVSEPDTGIYNAMNKGVMRSSGEYLLFLNSGDYLASSDVLANVFSQDCSADIIYGNLILSKSEFQKEEHQYPDTVSYMYLLRHSLPHPASFIKRELLVENPYDESLRIVSDWKFCLESLIGNKTFQHLNSYISVFDMNGICSTNYALDREERSRVISELCPVSVNEDIYVQQEVEDYLDHTELHQFLKLRKSHRALGKIINVTIRLMKAIDR